jgi:hypothetical protein
MLQRRNLNVAEAKAIAWTIKDMSVEDAMTALAHSRNLRWIWVERLCHSLDYNTVRAAVRSCGMYLFIRTDTSVGFALTAAHLRCLYTNISTDSTPIVSPDQD